jgi:hypothetical protein
MWCSSRLVDTEDILLEVRDRISPSTVCDVSTILVIPVMTLLKQ